MTPSLAALCDAAGIVWEFLDGAGRQTRAPEETCLALLRALGFEIRTEADVNRHLQNLQSKAKNRYLPDTIIINVDETVSMECAVTETIEWTIELEDGSCLQGTHRGGALVLPPLPLGIHGLHFGGQISVLLSAPQALTAPVRSWGLMAPLYGLGREPKKGIGTYRDLAEFTVSAASVGAGFVGINPVHAGFSGDPTSISPYSPSSRQWLNPLHISIQDLPQWPGLSGQFPDADVQGELVDYPSETERKTRLLKAAFSIFQEGGTDPDFTDFIEREGSALREFATHQALSDIHGPYWNTWPTELHRPDSKDVRAFARENQQLIQYHCWLQWVAWLQMRGTQKQACAAGMAYGLYLDLAVGTHPLGAETWADERAFARGVAIGSPPDGFSETGQNWNLAPFNPNELIKRRYKPLARTLRSQLQFCGVLRIDHILGFERSYWIPDGLPGAYVKFPRDALLAVTRIEAARVGATIIGEDLGNVPDGLRKALDQSGILGCRVAFFERNWKSDQSFVKAKNYSLKSLASITTHDLPTLLGWWKGLDIQWLNKVAGKSEAATDKDRAQRRKDRELFADLIGYEGSSSSGDMAGNEGGNLILAASAFLAGTRSCLAAVQIEDVLEMEQQPNLPGTITEHPNWRRRLPTDTSKIADLTLLKKISLIMKAADRSGKMVGDQRRI